MTRLLTNEEIEYILDFIQPSMDIPIETAKAVVKNNKNKLRSQLVTQKVYPEIIPKLKEMMRKSYMDTLIQAGESVGVICAQSIGEKNTQTTLNSVDWTDKILYLHDENAFIEPIGQMIDRLLLENKDNITYIQENRTEFINLVSGYMIPSTDENGMVNWYKIEAVTRHLPVGKLVKVTTSSGRTVMATQSKSFLVWNGKKFEGVLGADVKIGDILPTTCNLIKPQFMGFHKNDLFSDNDFAFLLGIYLSSGSITYPYLCIVANDHVKDRISDFCENYLFTYHTIIGNNIECIKIHPSILMDIIIDSCGFDESKQIPLFLYTSSEEFIKSFIDGYFSGKGCEINEKTITCSSSENIILGISFLMSYYGIFCSINDNTLHISTHKFANIFVLTNKEKIPKTYKYFIDTNMNMDVYFDEVVNVEYVNGTTPYVYDLTVEKTRNFQLFNGLNIVDTFHKAGMSEKTMTQGVPRFQELINATKKPRIVNHKIYLNCGNETIEETRLTVGSNIVGLTFSDISTSIVVNLNKDNEKWYDSFKILYHDNFVNHPHCITIKLNMQKLFEFHITVQDISNFIHSEYEDLFCVFSPPSIGQLDIFVDTSNIELPEERILFINKDNAEEIYLEECVQPIIEKMTIKGIQGISEIFYTQEGGEWIVETNGINSRSISTQFINFKKLLALDIIDETKTVSNNVWDIYEVFGIEAAREFLIEEFMSIMDGINSCHSCLLVDRMTYGGNISSITRYTMKKDESGPLGKASFEETMDNFLNAAAKGEIEPTEGVSAAIICGKRASIGTGMVNVQLDISKLPMAI